MERSYQKIDRRKTRTINVGKLRIGGKNPILVQTMTNTPTVDIKSTIAQIKRVADIGADIVRVSVPDKNSTEALKEIAESMEAINQAAESARKAGKLPGSLESILDEIKEPKVCWKQVLARFLRSNNTDDFSWQKPNRFPIMICQLNPPPPLF